MSRPNQLGTVGFLNTAPKRNWGAGLATDSPVAGLRSACLGRSPCRAIWFRRLATSALLPKKRRQVSRVCSVAWPEGQRNSAVSLGSKHPRTLFASPAPPTGPKASLLRGRPGRSRPKTLHLQGHAPPDPPEGTSSIAIAPPRKPEGFLNLASARSVWPEGPPDFAVRSSGPGAIIRRVSAFPATGGLQRTMPKHRALFRSPRHLSRRAV